MADQLSTTPEERDAPFPVGPSLLEEFASTVAHELATPLAVIQTATETALHLGEEVGADEQRRLLEVIRRNSNLAVLLQARRRAPATPHGRCGAQRGRWPTGRAAATDPHRKADDPRCGRAGRHPARGPGRH